MVSRTEFEEALSGTSRPDQRVAVLGALLTRESKLQGRLVVVGGSALQVYTGGRYVSGDVDIVGGRSVIAPILKKWGFEFDGRYWRRDDLELVVELGRDRYFGNWSGTTIVSTAVGPVRLAAPEDLIVRRLIYATGEFGEKGRRALDDAVLLYRLMGHRLDREYLESELEREQLEDSFEEMVRRSVPEVEPKKKRRRG